MAEAPTRLPAVVNSQTPPQQEPPSWPRKRQLEKCPKRRPRRPASLSPSPPVRVRSPAPEPERRARRVGRAEQPPPERARGSRDRAASEGDLNWEEFDKLEAALRRSRLRREWLARQQPRSVSEETESAESARPRSADSTLDELGAGVWNGSEPSHYAEDQAPRPPPWPHTPSLSPPPERDYGYRAEKPSKRRRHDDA